MTKNIPHSFDSEIGILGSILLENSIMDNSITQLSKEDFYDLSTRKIWQAMCYLYDNKKSIDLILITDYLEGKDELSDLRIHDSYWVQAIIEITQQIYTTANVPYYISTVKEKKILRDMMELGQTTQSLASGLKWWVLESINKAQEAYMNFQESTKRITSSSRYSLSEISKEYSENSNLKKYQTGIEAIDLHTGWLEQWQVMRLSAYSNTGKSKFSYFVCNNFLKQWAKVFYFSLEVTKTRVLSNLLSNYYQVDWNTIREKKDLSGYESYMKYPIMISDDIYDFPGILRMCRLEKPDIVFIDYVQQITQKGSKEYERMTDIATDIQQMAIREKLSVFDLSQVSNEWYNFKRWGMIPSKWSGALVHAADVWLMMYRDEDRRLRMNIAKNKVGRADIDFELIADFSKGNFSQGQYSDISQDPALWSIFS